MAGVPDPSHTPRSSLSVVAFSMLLVLAFLLVFIIGFAIALWQFYAYIPYVRCCRLAQYAGAHWLCSADTWLHCTALRCARLRTPVTRRMHAHLYICQNGV